MRYICWKKETDKEKMWISRIFIYFAKKLIIENDLGNQCIQKVGIYFYRINASKKIRKIQKDPSKNKVYFQKSSKD